jgi:hypothetical protein
MSNASCGKKIQRSRFWDHLGKGTSPLIAGLTIDNPTGWNYHLKRSTAVLLCGIPFAQLHYSIPNMNVTGPFSVHDTVHTVVEEQIHVSCIFTKIPVPEDVRDVGWSSTFQPSPLAIMCATNIDNLLIPQGRNNL